MFTYVLNPLNPLELIQIMKKREETNINNGNSTLQQIL